MTKRSKQGQKNQRIFTLSHQHRGQRLQVNLAYRDAAALAGVTEKTIERWVSGRQIPHPDTLALLQIKALRVLPWDGWRGFWLNEENELCTPGGFLLSPELLESYGFMLQVNRQMERELIRLGAEIKRLSALVPKAPVITLQEEKKKRQA